MPKLIELIKLEGAEFPQTLDKFVLESKVQSDLSYFLITNPTIEEHGNRNSKAVRQTDSLILLTLMGTDPLAYAYIIGFTLGMRFAEHLTEKHGTKV